MAAVPDGVHGVECPIETASVGWQPVTMAMAAQALTMVEMTMMVMIRVLKVFPRPIR